MIIGATVKQVMKENGNTPAFESYAKTINITLA